MKRGHRFGNRIFINLQTLLLFLSLSLLLSSGCSTKGGELRAGFDSGKYRTIVAFGDSIVEGHQQPEGWPEMLGRDLSGRYPGTVVVNSGVTGDTAGDGLRRIRNDVLDQDPDLVLIAFGLNDMKNGISLSQFRSDLSAIVLKIASTGAQPVLLTTTRLQQGVSMLGRLNPTPFNEIIRTLAKEMDLFLIDVNDRSKGLNTTKFLIDAAHPNLEGYRRLAEIIREGLIGE